MELADDGATDPNWEEEDLTLLGCWDLKYRTFKTVQLRILFGIGL